MILNLEVKSIPKVDETLALGILPVNSSPNTGPSSDQYGFSFWIAEVHQLQHLSPWVKISTYQLCDLGQGRPPRVPLRIPIVKCLAQVLAFSHCLMLLTNVFSFLEDRVLNSDPLSEISFLCCFFLYSKSLIEQERKRRRETKEKKGGKEKTIETKLFCICHWEAVRYICFLSSTIWAGFKEQKEDQLQNKWTHGLMWMHFKGIMWNDEGKLQNSFYIALPFM